MQFIYLHTVAQQRHLGLLGIRQDCGTIMGTQFLIESQPELTTFHNEYQVFLPTDLAPSHVHHKQYVNTYFLETLEMPLFVPLKSLGAFRSYPDPLRRLRHFLHNILLEKSAIVGQLYNCKIVLLSCKEFKCIKILNMQ